MVEMLGVLAIIGVLTVGGIAGYSKAMQKYRINKALDIISQIINNTKTTFAQQSSYKGISKARNLGIIPFEVGGYEGGAPDSETETAHILTLMPEVFREIHLERYDGFSPQAVVLLVNLSDNQDACIALASYDWNSALGDSLVGISISAGDTSGANALVYSSMTADSISYAYNGSDLLIAPAANVPLPMDTIAKVCKYVSPYWPQLGFSVIFR